VKFSKDENFGAQEVQASIQWPSLCELLFSIHGVVCNLLLTPNCALFSKDSDWNETFFQTLKIKIRQVTGHRWRPRRVICDFEQALLVAVETELRHAQISGC
jgi:hypothetical protein